LRWINLIQGAGILPKARTFLPVTV